MDRAKLIFALVVAVLVVSLLGAGWLAYDFFFVTHFDDANLRQSFETIQKKYAFPALTIRRLRTAGRHGRGRMYRMLIADLAR